MLADLLQARASAALLIMHDGVHAASSCKHLIVVHTGPVDTQFAAVPSWHSKSIHQNPKPYLCLSTHRREIGGSPNGGRHV